MTKPSMVLIEVTPGEWFDRVTQLEIQAHDLSGEQRQHVLDQLSRCRELPGGKIMNYRRHSEPVLRRLVDLLLVANSELQVNQACLDEFSDDSFPLSNYGPMDCWPRWVPDYVDAARCVYVSNTKRSELKQQIDEFFRTQYAPKEYANHG